MDEVQDRLIGVSHLGEREGSLIKREPRHILGKRVRSCTYRDLLTRTHPFYGGQAADMLRGLDQRREPFMLVPVSVLWTAELTNTNSDRAQARLASRGSQNLLANPFRLSVPLGKHYSDRIVNMLLDGVSRGV